MSLRSLMPRRPIGPVGLAMAAWRHLQRARARARTRADLEAMSPRERRDAGLPSEPVWLDDYRPRPPDGE